MREPSETRSVQIKCEGVVRSDEDIYTHIEFFVTDQKRIVDVSLNDVRLRLVGRVRPIRNLADPAKQENTLTLAATNRFHDPHQFLIFASFVFLMKNGILTGQVISKRKVIIPRCFFCLPLPFQCFFISLHILREKVLPANLIKIAKMVNPLLRKQSHLI